MAIAAFIGPALSLLEKVIPDKKQREKLAHELATMAERHAHEVALAQIEVNRTEAASNSLFKGGWRPFLGWVCGGAFAYHFVLQPVIVFLIVAFGGELPELPKFEMEALMTVLFGMLGLGGLRSFEKYKGVTK
jgi:hypothetical protein